MVNLHLQASKTVTSFDNPTFSLLLKTSFCEKGGTYLSSLAASDLVLKTNASCPGPA